MTKLPNPVELSVSVTPDWPTFVSELRRMADAIEAQAEAARECRTEERLVALFREHDYERMECHDHGGLCDQAGCHDLREDQAQHYARVVLALLPQRCAPTEAGRDLDGRTWDEYPAADELHKLADKLTDAAEDLLPAEPDERIAAWEAIAAHPIFAPCCATAAPLLPSMLDRLDGLDAQPAPQPPAVVLPTVDEVAEAAFHVTYPNSTHQTRGPMFDHVARSTLDLIADRLPVWQPAEPDADLVETIAQAILRHDTEGVVEWERCTGQGTYRGEARAVLDAIRAEYVIEKAARS